MKKSGIAVVLCLFFQTAGWSVNQPQNIGTITVDGGLGLWNQTLAQMNALIPDTTGQVIFVSDAVSSKLCVSTGAASVTNTGAWVMAVATGAFTAATYPHCN